VKFKLNHGYRVGQIIREGKHFRKVIKVMGPWYAVRPYCINEPLVSRPQPHDWAANTIDRAIRTADLTRR